MTDVCFDLDLWEWKALEDLIAYRDMHEFVCSEPAMDAHKSSMTEVSAHPELHPINIDEDMRASLEGSLRNSLSHFAGQTIVSLCTTYEVAAKEFFCCLFSSRPLLMHDYIGTRDQKGMLGLKDVVDANSYDEVIRNAAEAASNAAAKGKYSEILNRAQRLCKGKIGDSLKKEIGAVQVLRNRIVHEKYVGPLDIDAVTDAHTHVADAIKVLGELAIEQQVPGKYTYICPKQTIELTSFSVLTPKGSSP